MILSIKRSKGFSLFEVLISLLVLSVGLLGLANLQGRSIASSYNAHLRTQATSLAQSMVDRMRANRNHAMLSTNNYQTDYATEPPAISTDCAATICSQANMALYDLTEWKCNLGMFTDNTNCAGLVSQVTLPSGEGRISAPDSTTGQTTVTVRWRDTDGAQHTVTMYTSL